jgi:hypothetical protein
MGDKPTPTPQALRAQAQQAIRLAHSITNEQARTGLLAFAQELLQKAAELEAAGTIIIAPTEAIAQTGTAAAMLDTTASTKPPDSEDSN